MSSYTAQDLETLRRQAQEIDKVLAARQAAEEESYRQQQAALEAQRENALRQAYITQQQTLAQLPEYMAAGGINGGLAESSLVQLGRAYGNQRSDIQSQYDQGLQNLQLQQSNAAAEAAARRAQNQVDYLGAYSAIEAQQKQQEQQLAFQQQQLALQREQQQWERELQQMTARANRAAQQVSQPTQPAGPTEPTGTSTSNTGSGKSRGSGGRNPLSNNRVDLIR